MRALKLMQASAIQIQAIIGYGCDCSLLLYRIEVAMKSKPVTDNVNKPTKMTVMTFSAVPDYQSS